MNSDQEKVLELTIQQKFEEKIKDRLRQSVGDLMPDETLADLTKKAMNEMFFKRKLEKQGGYYDKEVETPSWFEDEVYTQLKEKIDVQLKEYLIKNQADLEMKIQTMIVAKAPELLAQLLMKIFTQQASSISFNIADSIRQSMQNGVIR